MEERRVLQLINKNSIPASATHYTSSGGVGNVVYIGLNFSGSGLAYRFNSVESGVTATVVEICDAPVTFNTGKEVKCTYSTINGYCSITQAAVMTNYSSSQGSFNLLGNGIVFDDNTFCKIKFDNPVKLTSATKEYYVDTE